jgi:hypothetical protein
MVRRASTRALLVALVMTLGLAAAAGPAGAVTFGQPDDGEHPNVGLVYFELPDGVFRCSGTLIAPTVVLTAGHCTASEGQPNLRTWVTFDERVDIPDDVLELPDDEFGDWLTTQPNFITGTAVPHPRFDDFAQFPAIFDIGAVVLDEAVVEIAPARLPRANLLDGLRGQERSNFTVVGYGLQGVINPFFGAERARYKGDVRLIEVQSAFTGLASAKFSNNPGRRSGGSCFGDSGGPVFHGSDTVAALVSWASRPASVSTTSTGSTPPIPPAGGCRPWSPPGAGREAHRGRCGVEASSGAALSARGWNQQRRRELVLHEGLTMARRRTIGPEGARASRGRTMSVLAVGGATEDGSLTWEA